MTNQIKFNEVVKRNGKKIYEAATAMGMSSQSLYNKLNNVTEFTQTELQKFRDFFPDVSDDEFKQIFFAVGLTAEVNE